MKREEFILQLKNKLDRLPADELNDVVAYYNEIFLDAGEENEESTAVNLGSVDDIARQIYVENNIDPDGRPEFVMGDVISEKQNTATSKSKPVNNVNNDSWSILGKVLLLVITFPIWFSIIVILFSLLFSLAVTLLALGFSLGFVGICLTVVGIPTIFKAPPVGLIVCGAGLIILSIFILIAGPICKGAWNMMVRFCNWFVEKLRKIFIERRGA